jgi:hypothetical protein
MFLIGLALPVSYAEMSAFELPPGGIHMYGKGDTPDPFPWGAIHPPEFCCILNEDGDTRGDGWPDFDVNPVSMHAEVVWAYQDPNDSQIAFAESLDTGGWTPIFILASTTSDELDPKIGFSPTGGTKIVYWRDDATPKVFIIERRSPTDLWTSPTRVSSGNDPARHPSVAVAQGKVHVAYEVDVPSGGKDIIISGRADDPNSGGTFQPELIAHTSYTGQTKLQVESRASASTLWVSWVHSATQVGYSKFNGAAWDLPQYKPCNDCGLTPPQDEDDLQAVRNEIRRNMLGGN